MAALTGKVARIKITASTPTSSTDVGATLLSGGFTVTCNVAARRHWNRNTTAVHVYKGGVEQTQALSPYAIDWPVGSIRFTSHHTTGTYKFDMEWLAASYLGNTQSWGLDVQTDALDVTAFSTGSAASPQTWRTFVPGLSQATVRLGRLHTEGDTGPLFVDRQALDSDLIVDLIVNATGDERYTGYCRVEGLDLTADVVDLSKENVTLRVDGELYYATSS